MPRLFISYAREDQQWVEAFSRALAAAGFEVWRDNAIPTGEPFGRVIERAIADANAVVVVWSKDSIESDWVRAEATEGLRREILIPVRRDISAPPLRFRTLQTIDLSGWRFNPDYPTFDGLVHELHRRMDVDGTGGGDGDGNGARVVASSGGSRPAWRRFWLPAAALLAVAALSLFWYLHDQRNAQQLALELTAAARAERDAILEEQGASRRYWYYFLSDQGGQARVERAVLLALEAVRRQRTPETLAVLREALLLLPAAQQRWRLGETISRAAISADRQRLAWANRHGLWVSDLGADRAARQISSEGVLEALLFLERSNHLLSLDGKGGVQLWNSAGDRMLWQLSDEAGRVLDFAVSGDAMRLALKWQGEVGIVDLPNGELVQRIETLNGRNQRSSSSIAMDRDGRYLGVAVGKQLLIHDLGSRKTLHRIEYDAPVTALAFDPNDNGLLLAFRDGRVTRLSLPFGDSADIAAGPSVAAMRFSPGGRYLALASGARVRVVAGEDPQRTLLEYRHDDRVMSLSFSDAGERVASVGQDGDVRVFAIPGQRELARLSHPDQVMSVAFGADAKRLVTVGRVGSVARWSIDYESPEREACRRLARALTLEEWHRFLPGEAYRPSCPEEGADG
jgi:hypothetical protein